MGGQMLFIPNYVGSEQSCSYGHKQKLGNPQFLLSDDIPDS